MCFSFEVSLATGIFSWATSLYLLNKGVTESQRHDLIYLMIFSSMQFADAILWYIEMEKNDINYVVTSFVIPTLLAAQGIYKIYYKNKIDNKLIDILTMICVPYLFIRFNGYSSSFCSNKLSSPVWGSKDLALWEILLFAAYVTYPRPEMFISILVMKALIDGAFGSMWCAIANLQAIKYLMLY